MIPDKNPDELYLDVRLLNNLYDTARWGKVLAVLGFILSAFTLVLGLFMQRLASSPLLSEDTANLGFSGFTIVAYAFVALVYFFPSLYLFSFAVRLQQGVEARNRQQVHRAINKLKILFKFLIIMLLLFLLLLGLSLVLLATGNSGLAL